jgi:hypothetical protein
MKRFFDNVFIIAGLVIIELLLAYTDGIITVGISGILIMYMRILETGESESKSGDDRKGGSEDE